MCLLVIPISLIITRNSVMLTYFILILKSNFCRGLSKRQTVTNFEKIIL